MDVLVIAPLPERWGLCRICQIVLDQTPGVSGDPKDRTTLGVLDEYPPDWQERFRRLETLLRTLSARYDGRVRWRVLDPRSLQGLWASIRYGVRRYPTFVIAGKKLVVETDADVAWLEDVLHIVEMPLC
jgi:hypothetical protein